MNFLIKKGRAVDYVVSLALAAILAQTNSKNLKTDVSWMSFSVLCQIQNPLFYIRW